MRRLIYAPKAYIFIKSSNTGTVYDVSADITSGSVTQNLNDLSKARWTLRNRYRKWIRDPNSNQQIFLPMDMVTIWLQRIAGRPIQVFTGYLDEVPYYQGYPGDAIFSASCTLKKLAFTWFDPGLPFFQQWVMTSDGWQITPDGEAFNPNYLTTAEALAPGESLSQAPSTTSTINDTGFDALTGRFLTEVAGWSTEDVLISDLPSNLPALAAKLYSTINSDTEQDLSILETALGQTMGISGWQNADSSTPTTSNNSPAQTPAAVKVLQTMKTATDQANVPLLVAAFAAYVTTNLDPTHSNVGGDGKYGLFAMIPNGQSGAGPGTSSNTPTIDGVLVSTIVGNATSATNIFCNRYNSPANVKAQQAIRSSLTLSNIQPLVENVLGYKLPTNVDLQSAFTTAQKYVASSTVQTTPSSSPSSSVDPASLTWADLTGSGQYANLLTDAEQNTVRNFYSSSKPWLAGIVYRAKQISQKNITLIKPIGKGSATSVTITGTVAALTSFFSALTSDSTIDSVDSVINGRHDLLQNGVPSNLGIASGTNNTIVVTQNQAPVAATTPSSTDTSSNGTSTLGGALGTLSANAAFAAQFAFPTNTLEAQSLTGNRALMNDVSCLDGVKQFCQASLRVFRSLPDGRFMAFYPDYFGASRQPYWQIYNIEITNFGIQLNDDALATHVYVVGDTFDGDGQISWQDEVSTRGVATLTQAFMLNSFIESDDSQDNTVLGRLTDAYTFIQHYGARPHEEDQPLIRNVFYEFLLAWQRFMQLWAAQFATTCTFTFQPEVMAGGLISFPDHGIQMFCNSVTHTWDYTSGFQTEAVLTSPSLLPGKSVDPQTKPGFALAGNINTVGFASG